MPWQSIVNFNGGTGKRKEQSPAPTSDTGSSVDQHAVTPQRLVPASGNTFSATEQQTNAHVNFAPDAWPAR